MQGDKSAGFSIFWGDDGLDTGPILLQKKCYVDPNETVDSIYNRFMFPEGIKSMVLQKLFYYSLKTGISKGMLLTMEQNLCSKRVDLKYIEDMLSTVFINQLPLHLYLYLIQIEFHLGDLFIQTF